MRGLLKRRCKVDPLPVIRALAAIDYLPGDMLVIETERRIPREAADRLRAQLSEKTGCRVLLLESGLELMAVLREERVTR